MSRSRPAFPPARRQSRRSPFPLLIAGTVIGAAGWAVDARAQSPSADRAGSEPSPVATNREADEVGDYAIEPGPLADVLTRYLGQAGLLLAGSLELARDRQSPGLNGRYAARDGLDALLRGSGLRARHQADGSYVLEPVPGEPSTQWSAQPSGLPDRSLHSLRAVRVSARRSGETEGSGAYTSDAITVGKTAQSLREMPQSVTVITRQRLDDQALLDLGSVAEQTAGITVRNVSYRLPAFYSRGFQIESLQLDGGAPMEIAMYGNIVPEMAQYDRVEVLRGAAGLLNGTGNPGGAINLVRKMPTRTPQFSVAASIGRWDSYRAEADVSGPLAFDGKLRGRAVLAYDDRKSFQDHRATRKPFFYGVLEADLGPTAVLSVGYREARFKEKGAPDGLPRYSNGADLRLPRHVSLTQDWAFWDGESTEVFGKLSWRLADRWTLRVNATRARQHGYQKGAFAWGGVDPITLEGSQWYGAPQEYWDRQGMFDLNLSGAFDLLGRTHEVLVGVDTQRIRSRWLGNRGHGEYPAVDVFDPDSFDWAEPPTDRWMRDYNPDGRKQYGAAPPPRLAVADGLKAIVGARANKYKYHQEYRWTLDRDSGTWDNPWTLAAATRYTESVKVTPFAGLVYDIDERWSVYGSYAQIFQPQADRKAGPMPGSALAPMRGRNLEIGLKGELLERRLNTHLALYRTVQDQRAIIDSRFPSESVLYAGSCCYLQQGKVISQGIDAELSGEIAEGVQLYAGYTYNHNRDRTENAIFSTITPKHLLRFWGNWQLPGAASAWQLGAGASIQSRQYVKGTSLPFDPATGSTGTEEIPFEYSQGGYAIWNAMISYRLSEVWTLTANLNNLTDKHYYRTVSDAGGGNFYGEPRNLIVTLRGRF